MDRKRSYNAERRFWISSYRYGCVLEAGRCFTAADRGARVSCQGPAPRPYTSDDKANAGGTIDLAMKWLSPSHLEVTYDKHPDLYFQAVKMDGIQISVRDLSDGSR